MNSTDFTTPKISIKRKLETITPSLKEAFIKFEFTEDDVCFINIPEEVAIYWNSTEYDPAVAFSFQPDRIKVGIDRINNLQPRLPIPDWFPVGTNYPIAMEQFQLAILSQCTQVTLYTLCGNFSIGPNTLLEFSKITNTCAGLCLDPFVQSMANFAGGHLAQIYIFTDKTVRQQGQAVNLYVYRFPVGNIQAII